MYLETGEKIAKRRVTLVDYPRLSFERYGHPVGHTYIPTLPYAVLFVSLEACPNKIIPLSVRLPTRRDATAGDPLCKSSTALAAQLRNMRDVACDLFHASRPEHRSRPPELLATLNRP